MSSQLLSQLPAFSRIVTPDATIYIKQGDGVWYRWANFKYDSAVQVSLHARRLKAARRADM